MLISHHCSGFLAVFRYASSSRFLLLLFKLSCRFDIEPGKISAQPHRTNPFSQWQCIVFVIVFSNQELNAYCRMGLLQKFYLEPLRALTLLEVLRPSSYFDAVKSTWSLRCASKCVFNSCSHTSTLILVLSTCFIAKNAGSLESFIF